MFLQFGSRCATLILKPKNFAAALGRNFNSTSTYYSTVEHQEVNKFSKRASTFWWNKELILHSMNTVRVPFIRDGLLAMSGKRSYDDPSRPLKGLKIIDVGCGGGILSEPLARLGAEVTGLDPGPENIEVAVEHASPDIKGNLTYVCDSIENIVESHVGGFDAVVCSEVIEHVADVNLFLKCCVDITKEGGSLFFTTPNRSVVSYFTNIVMAEYILQFLKPGTHDWNKFITPDELSSMLLSLNCRIVSTEGIVYNPVSKKFGWSNKSMLYALHACK